MDRGAWRAIAHEVANSQTWLNTHTHTHTTQVHTQCTHRHLESTLRHTISQHLHAVAGPDLCAPSWQVTTHSPAFASSRCHPIVEALATGMFQAVPEVSASTSFHLLPLPHSLKNHPIEVIYSGKAMAAHSSTLAWQILRMEEPGGLQSMGSHRVRRD